MDVYTNDSLKSWDELTFTDDYMFKLVMSKHPKFIKKLLEIILQIKVRDIRFHETEKNLKESYDGHGIRFDLSVLLNFSMGSVVYTPLIHTACRTNLCFSLMKLPKS